jgi:putative two-component system response regulator
VALRRAGIIHDIGKIAVPDKILLKPGPLAPDERRIVEHYPVVGEQLCAPVKSFREVLPIIRHHHERIDGSGYPDGLKKDQIPLPARILSVVDIYDALTTDRPYRKALSQWEAIQTIRKEAGRGWWDVPLVDQLEVVVFRPAPLAVNGYSAGNTRRDGTTNSS